MMREAGEHIGADVFNALRRRDLLKYMSAAGAGLGLSAGAGGLAAAPASAADGQQATSGAGGGLPEWSELVEQLKPAGALNQITLAPDDDQLRMELYRQFIMNMALGYFVYFQTDPSYPDWVPFLNSAFLLQPNPDDVYHTARLNDEGTYRISGNRGSVRLLLFSIGHEIMGTSDRVGGESLGLFDADELNLGEDGSFDVILSPTRPEGYEGDWWQLRKGAQSILARQRSYDWGGEVDARFAIERVDLPPEQLRPRTAAVDVAEQLREVMDYPERLSRLWIAYQNQSMTRIPANTMEITDFGGAMPMQAYLQGVYQLEPDEAVILETDVPEARYWNFQMADSLWNQVDFVHRQSSLNGYQAQLDSDGRFRAVISLQDPGVPNWLDPGGFTHGMMIGRWLGAESFPLPKMTRVKFADIRKHLPEDTPTLGPGQRHEQIRQRRVGAQLRRRW